MTTEQLNDPQEWAAILALKEGKPIQLRYCGEWKNTDDYLPGYQHRPKPVPVPPGDLTWEEAKALDESGTPIQYHTLNQWADCEGGESDVWPTNIAYRRTPQPTDRCACGHEWERHNEQGCTYLVDGMRSQICYCRVTRTHEPKPSLDLCECGHSWDWHRIHGCWALDSTMSPCKCKLTRPPEPKRMVPLSHKDVPAGTRLQRGGTEDEWLVVQCNRHDVSMVAVDSRRNVLGACHTYEELQRNGWEWTPDAGATWKRAEKEATE